MSGRALRVRTNVLGLVVDRDAALPPASGASEDLFSTTGQVLLTGLAGLVTVAVPNEVLSFDLALDPDDGAGDVALGTAVSVQAKAANTWITLNPTVGGALLVRYQVQGDYGLTVPLMLSQGDIKLNTTGGGAIGTDARVAWLLSYVPLSDDGAILAV
jgi:hypothetical protein